MIRRPPRSTLTDPLFPNPTLFRSYSDWEVVQLFANALGLDWIYTHPSQIMDEIAALTPTFAGVHYDRLEEEGSLQWPANEAAPDGTPTMNVDGLVRGKGKFVVTDYEIGRAAV